ncbi:uncharacterized protein L199_004367 [Kwoniella botswanensis]|uniref:uncharacterized protein n=1 Tax=Kwoniella botswanensis TaxID=1268659 RepID=UPI00315D005F
MSDCITKASHTDEPATRALDSSLAKRLRNINAGGRSYDSLRCQRLVEDTGNIRMTENGPNKVSIPTDCGREISLKSSKDCTTAGYCAWNLYDEHLCKSCGEQGEVVDFDYHIANFEEGNGDGESAGA